MKSLSVLGVHLYIICCWFGTWIHDDVIFQSSEADACMSQNLQIVCWQKLSAVCYYRIDLGLSKFGQALKFSWHLLMMVKVGPKLLASQICGQVRLCEDLSWVGFIRLLVTPVVVLLTIKHCLLQGGGSTAEKVLCLADIATIALEEWQVRSCIDLYQLELGMLQQLNHFASNDYLILERGHVNYLYRQEILVTWMLLLPIVSRIL